MGEPEQKWSEEDLNGDGVSKKDLVTFLQENGSLNFQSEHKIKGQLKNIAKSRSKDELILAYKALFETKAFKAEGEDEAAAAAKAAKDAAVEDVTEKTKKLAVEDEGPPKYTKQVLKKGDKINHPKKGEVVAVFYTGFLEDGKKFDTNVQTGRNAKKAQPLKFKVGMGRVIRGWDEVLMTMSTGEKAKVVIEPEWAYGRKGKESSPGVWVVPRDARLTFEMELVGINA